MKNIRPRTIARPARRNPARLMAGAGLLVTLGLAACSGGGGGAGGGAVVVPPGGTFPDPSGSGLLLFSDANSGGAAQEMRVTRLTWGRLVQVFGLDTNGIRVPMNQDFLINGSLDSDGSNFLLETNPVTSQQNLIVLRDVTDTTAGGGREQFYNLLRTAEASLSFIQDVGLGGSGIHSLVPRNATIMVQFDDLVDPSTINDRTVRVLTGNPTNSPFEARYLVDANHGGLVDRDGDGVAEFYPTRLLIDTTVSEIESFEADPPLPVNGVGLPPSVTTTLSNVQVRIPTVLNQVVQQTKLLSNLTGHAITSVGNGSVDFSSLTVDVVRTMRSGGSSAVTGDDNNGFLFDNDAPVVVGRNPGQIPAGFPPVSTNGGDEFLLPRIEFSSIFCAQTPSPGDVLVQPGLFAEVIQTPAPVAGGVVENVRVRLILYPDEWDLPGGDGPLTWIQSAIGSFSFRSPYTPSDDTGKEPCFVQIFPTPLGFPANPGSQLFTNSTMGLRFSEPMDPASLTAFDSLTLTRSPAPGQDDPPLPSSDYVVGTVSQSLDLREFTFLPDLPLAHQTGVEEDYYLTVVAGSDGPTDLAGNPVGQAIPSVQLNLWANNPQVLNGGRVSRFTSPDEEPPVGSTDTGGPKPEWSGQHLFDLSKELIRPRPVTRFRGYADRDNALPALMTPFTLGVQTPLSSLGSKMQTVWRYADFGFSLTDSTNQNLDIEGMYWSPASGQVIFDSYSEFSITLSHCKFAPDEWIDPATLFPFYNNSGLRHQYGNNFLNEVQDPPKVVHPAFRGYTVQPGEMFIKPSSNVRLIPYPLNRTVAPDERVYYTWRDTRINARGGNSSGGVPPQQEYVALGLAPPPNPYFPAGQIPSTGLPLLMEFRCYPDDGAAGINAFDISLACNTSSMPYFRAFSTGGTNTSSNNVTVDPDTQVSASGGFNPNSLPTAGQVTYGRDNTFYIGALDFVVRISRSSSVWFPATNPNTGDPFLNPIFNPAIVEPRPEDQPGGTEVRIQFRGASNIVVDPSFTFPAACPDPPDVPTVHPALETALSLDIYGDHYWDDPVVACPDTFPNHHSNRANRGITFVNNEFWRDTVSEIDGSRFYQLQITFVSNPLTGLVPELSALALSWQSN